MSRSLINIDIRQLDLVNIALKNVRNGSRRALQNATNKSLTHARSTFLNAIKDEYALDKISSQHKSALVSMKRAKPSDLTASLHYKSKSIPLINFKVKPKYRHTGPYSKLIVKAEIRKGSSESFPYSFIAKMPKTNHWGVFTRTGKFVENHRDSKYGGKRKNGKNIKREGIRQLFSTSVPQMVEQVQIRHPDIRERIQTQFEANINEQVRNLLAKDKK